MSNAGLDLFQKGYTDAYYGKDNSTNYEGIARMCYRQGQDKFHKEFKESVDVMKELNG